MSKDANWKGLLQVVLFSYNDKGERTEDEDRYNAIRFPQEDTLASIQRSLGQYLKGGPERIDSVDILYPMANINDKWIWHEPTREDWDLVIEQLLQNRRVLAVRQRRILESKADSERFFPRGPVILTQGSTVGGLTKWTDVPAAKNPNFAAQIDRPVSYKNAIDLIIKGANAKHFVMPPAYQGIVDIKDLDRVAFKFYYFATEFGKLPSTDIWIEFPAEAYKDDDLWRTIVPKAHRILGYSMHQLGSDGTGEKSPTMPAPPI